MKIHHPTSSRICKFLFPSSQFASLLESGIFLSLVIAFEIAVRKVRDVHFVDEEEPPTKKARNAKQKVCLGSFEVVNFRMVSRKRESMDFTRPLFPRSRKESHKRDARLLLRRLLLRILLSPVQLI